MSPAEATRPGGAWLNCRAAALLGLLTSTFSSLVAQMLAAQIGRDAVVDWIVAAAIPGGDAALEARPGWRMILGGIQFHLWADLSWVVFFGPLGRRTAGLRPLPILLVGIPWAVLTSGLEWLFLVPAAPFCQPVFPLNQVWWIGLLVHLTSASLYPLFPWLRDQLTRQALAPGQARFAVLWADLAAAGLTGIGLLALLGLQGGSWHLPAAMPPSINPGCAAWRRTTRKGWRWRRSAPPGRGTLISTPLPG